MPKVRLNKLKGLVQDGGTGFYADSFPCMGVSGSVQLVTSTTVSPKQSGVYVLSASSATAAQVVTVTMPQPADHPGALMVFRDGCYNTFSEHPQTGQSHVLQIAGGSFSISSTTGIAAPSVGSQLTLSGSGNNASYQPAGGKALSSVALLSDGVNWQVIGCVGTVTKGNA